MKKIQASNWISAARSVSPQVVTMVSARSSMVRPRAGMTMTKGETYQAASN